MIVSVLAFGLLWFFQTSVASAQTENLNPELFRRTVPTNDPAEIDFALSVPIGYEPDAARHAVEAACERAAREAKAVFIKSGHPGCSPCRVFDRYHGLPEVQEILGKYYVIVAIDIKYMPDGMSTFSQYAKPGAPAWVIISPAQQVIVDSYGPEGNMGLSRQPGGSGLLSRCAQESHSFDYR